MPSEIIPVSVCIELDNCAAWRCALIKFYLKPGELNSLVMHHPNAQSHFINAL